MASEVKSFCCTNCGAPLEVPKGSGGKVICPYCKTVCVIEDFTQNAQIKEKNNINSGLPLTMTPEKLHGFIVKSLTAQPAMPLDALEDTTVLKEEHLCIPAYLFYCNAMGSFTYEKGIERERVVDKKKEKYTEWTPMSSMTSATQTVVASGSKEHEELVQELYSELSPASLVDVEALDFPADTESFSYDVPEVAAFSQYAKPGVEEKLKKQAAQQVAGGQTRNFNMSGINVQKDSAVRILLGVYHVVYSYHDQIYEIYFTADGSKSISSGVPTDPARKQTYDTLQKELKELEGSGCGVFMIGVVCLIAGFFFPPLLFLAAILLVIGIRNFMKNNKATDAKKAEIKAFTDQTDAAISAFTQAGQPLKGIYADLQLSPSQLAAEAKKLYTVVLTSSIDRNDIKTIQALDKAGVTGEYVKGIHEGTSLTLAENLEEEQANALQEKLKKAKLETKVLPQGL